MKEPLFVIWQNRSSHIITVQMVGKEDIYEDTVVVEGYSRLQYEVAEVFIKWNREEQDLADNELFNEKLNQIFATYKRREDCQSGLSSTTETDIKRYLIRNSELVDILFNLHQEVKDMYGIQEFDLWLELYFDPEVANCVTLHVNITMSEDEAYRYKDNIDKDYYNRWKECCFSNDNTEKHAIQWMFTIFIKEKLNRKYNSMDIFFN